MRWAKEFARKSFEAIWRAWNCSQLSRLFVVGSFGAFECSSNVLECETRYVFVYSIVQNSNTANSFLLYEEHNSHYKPSLSASLASKNV